MDLHAPAGTGLAFVVLAHKEPAQIARLVALLAADALDTVVIHVDARASAAVFGEAERLCGGRGNVRFAPRLPCHWADYSLVEAAAAAIETLIATDRPWSHLTLLSGADYPIKPISALRRLLAAEPEREFIEAFDLDLEPPFIDGLRQERTAYRWPFPARRHGLAVFKLWSMLQQAIDMRLMPPPGLQIAAGSQWWTLTRAGVEAVRTNLADAELRRFFAGSFVPDELVFPTAVLNSARRPHIARRNLCEVCWRPTGTPHILDEAFFGRLARSDRFFARKVDPRVSAGLLDRIDRDLLGSGGAS